jgi:hypothetical protein
LLGYFWVAPPCAHPRLPGSSSPVCAWVRARRRAPGSSSLVRARGGGSGWVDLPLARIRGSWGRARPYAPAAAAAGSSSPACAPVTAGGWGRAPPPFQRCRGSALLRFYGFTGARERREKMKGQKGHFLCLFDTVEPKKKNWTQVRTNFLVTHKCEATFFHGIQVKDSRQIGSM